MKMSHSRRRYRRILAFDPGLTTGVGGIENGEIAIAAILPLQSITEVVLSSLVRILQPEVVLVERQPFKNPNQKVLALEQYLNNWYTTAGFDVRLINPSQYKKLIDRTQVETDHLRDALDMARWYYQTYYTLNPLEQE